MAPVLLLHFLLLVGCVLKTVGVDANSMRPAYNLNLVLEPKSTSQIYATWTVSTAPSPITTTTNVLPINPASQDHAMPETFLITWGEVVKPMHLNTSKTVCMNYTIKGLTECVEYWVLILAQEAVPDMANETTFLTAPTDLQIGSNNGSGSRIVTWSWESNRYPDNGVNYTVKYSLSSSVPVELTTKEKELVIWNSAAEGTVCVVAHRDPYCESLPTCRKYGSSSEGGSNLGLILGCVLGGVAIVVAVCCAGYWYHRKKKPHKTRDIQVMFGDNTDQVTLDPVGGHTNRLTMEEELRDQFRRLFDPSVSTSNPSLTTTIAIKHRDKNRFADVLPYDHTLVRVSSVDYINASYVLGRKFIATQDPLPSQEEDFWQMIWDCNVRVAVQLSVNSPSQAVARIINDSGNNNWVVGHDELRVTMVKKNNNGIFCRRTHTLVKGMIERPLEHFHLTSWDEKSSANRDHVLKLVVAAKEVWHTMGPNSPVLVYCGAGAGRTGTFIAVWHMIEKKLPATLENMAATVREMRTSRKFMVQTEDQYVFIYNCVEDYNKNPSQWSQPEVYEMAH